MRPKFDYAELRARIREKFGTPEDFAAAVGFLPAEIRAKLSNSAEFKLSEIDRVCECLGIGNDEVDSVFFEAK
ncbi:MAG: DUF739 family protein [Chitinispirillales bacterium]|jgi:hypothetical protein|nr:DUF739 family protein [Chitinispirillales bacterium]